MRLLLHHEYRKILTKLLRDIFIARFAKVIGYDCQMEQHHVLPENDNAVAQNLVSTLSAHILLDLHLVQRKNFGRCAVCYVTITLVTVGTGNHK